MDVDNTVRAPDRADEIGLIDLALIVAENLRLLIIVPLAAGLIGLGNGYLTPPTYTATTRILLPLQQQSPSAALAAQLGVIAGLAGAPGARSASEQYVSFLKSGPVLDGMIERFKLKDLWKVQYRVDARRKLEGVTKISAGARDGIISIDVDDQDPKRAADMANGYVEELRNLLANLAVTEPAQRRLFYETQLKQAKDNLNKSEIALRESGVSSVILRTMAPNTLGVIADLRARITVQELRLASMRVSMTDSNPEFRVVLQELAALRAELSKVERANPAKPDGDGGQYIAKFREFKYHETLLELLVKQYGLAQLDEAREGAIIQVLDVALPPERKSKPNKAQMAVFTTLATFFIVVLFVFMRHGIRSIAKDENAAAKLEHLRRLFLFRRT